MDHSKGVRPAKRPVYTVRRTDGAVTVNRPGSDIAHGFDDLRGAVRFIRAECRGLAVRQVAVELWVAELYMVAYFDPAKRERMFGV